MGPESAQAILDAAGDGHRDSRDACRGHGMRRGEILGLRWSDVDLEAGAAQVRQTLQDTADGLVFEAAKTDRSRRTVSLPAFVVTPSAGIGASRQPDARRSAGHGWTTISFSTAATVAPCGPIASQAGSGN